jgi:SAM-dependent methyltransferase
MDVMAQEESRPFRDFELAGWQKTATGYHNYFFSLTNQTVAAMLDALEIESGSHMLDVASGPGYVAAAAEDRGADVIGIDFSELMVDQARQLHPKVKFACGDAESLSFGNETFDAVAMNFGLIHLDRPERAIAEAFRVLKKQGRFAFTVWAPPEEAIGFGIVLEAIERHGDSTVELPAGPPFFRFSDPNECKRVLQDAGFAVKSIKKMPMLWRFHSPAHLFSAFYTGTPRTGGLLRAQTQENLRAIEAEVIATAKRYRRGEGIEIPMASLLVAATK